MIMMYFVEERDAEKLVMCTYLSNIALLVIFCYKKLNDHVTIVECR